MLTSFPDSEPLYNSVASGSDNPSDPVRVHVFCHGIGAKSAAMCQANQAAKKPNTPNQTKRPHVLRVWSHLWKCSLSVSSFSLLSTAGISMAKNMAIQRIQPSVHMVMVIPSLRL